MSLRAFHVVFITCSTLLALLFGWWCVGEYRADGGLGYLWAGVGSAGAALGLLVYGSWFRKKMILLLGDDDRPVAP